MVRYKSIFWTLISKKIESNKYQFYLYYTTFYKFLNTSIRNGDIFSLFNSFKELINLYSECSSSCKTISSILDFNSHKYTNLIKTRFLDLSKLLSSCIILVGKISKPTSSLVSLITASWGNSPYSANPPGISQYSGNVVSLFDLL